MLELYLVNPSLEYERVYIEMIEEWKLTNEKIIPWVLKQDYQNFLKMVENLTALEKGINLNSTQVKCSTYWLMRSDGKMLGASNIRHELNAELENYGGHIGYGIRPGERNQGYATELLRLSLEKIYQLGVKKVRITCDSDNFASEKVIIKNGGFFDSETINEGRLIKRFWISL